MKNNSQILRIITYYIFGYKCWMFHTITFSIYSHTRNVSYHYIPQWPFYILQDLIYILHNFFWMMNSTQRINCYLTLPLLYFSVNMLLGAIWVLGHFPVWSGCHFCFVHCTDSLFVRYCELYPLYFVIFVWKLLDQKINMYFR